MFGAPQWDILLTLVIVVTIVALVVAGSYMVIAGATRIAVEQNGGRPLFWLGGPIFGIPCGILIGVLIDKSVNLTTVSIIAVVATGLIWLYGWLTRG